VKAGPTQGPRREKAGPTPQAGSLRRLLRRLAVGFVGSVVVVAGLLLVPLPGPGWAVVFAGVALLGTEFSWADRLLREVRRRLTPAAALLQRVPRPVRAAAVGGAAAAGLVGLVLSLVLLR
jgi:uncharacterized protein (TIGR02611 family)